MGILPADTKSIKDIMTRGDIFPSLLVARALVRLDDLSEISCPFSAILSRSHFQQNFLERRVLAPSISRLCFVFLDEHHIPPVLVKRTAQPERPGRGSRAKDEA
jgi:hypothetical protein